jgi:hypothetical protein
MACGVKGPPVAPKPTIPPAVKDLKAEVVGDMVRLTWSLREEGDVPIEGIEHIEVYRYHSPVSEKFCAGCPIPFQRVLDIKLKDPQPARLEGPRMIWHDEIEPGHRYAYKVVLHHKSGGISEDSNVVQFVTETDITK